MKNLAETRTAAQKGKGYFGPIWNELISMLENKNKPTSALEKAEDPVATLKDEET